MDKEPAASDMRKQELAISKLDPQSAFEIADEIAGGSEGATRTGKPPKEALRAAGPKQDVATTGGPRSKMARVAESAGTMERIQRFEASAGRTSVLRSCDLSLECV